MSNIDKDGNETKTAYEAYLVEENKKLIKLSKKLIQQIEMSNYVENGTGEMFELKNNKCFIDLKETIEDIPKEYVFSNIPFSPFTGTPHFIGVDPSAPGGDIPAITIIKKVGDAITVIKEEDMVEISNRKAVVEFENLIINKKLEL